MSRAFKDILRLALYSLHKTYVYLLTLCQSVKFENLDLTKNIFLRGIFCIKLIWKEEMIVLGKKNH